MTEKVTDEQILTDALNIAVPAYQEITAGHSLLTQPPPDDSILGPLSAAIEKCDAFKAVNGHMLFSADSGVVLHSPTLAHDLLSKKSGTVPELVNWLLKLLTTREAKGKAILAIWGLSVEEQIHLNDDFSLTPFDALRASIVKDRIVERARKLHDNAAWLTDRWFDKPRAALVKEFPEFPYIRNDDTAFLEINRFIDESRNLLTLIETLSVGRPLTFGYWFEYDDQSLDIESWQNNISWMLPEVVPSVTGWSTLDGDQLKTGLGAYSALPDDLKSRLLRSMKRFALSQSRHQLIDRAFDLALAFEIAVSGKGGGGAPPGWKVAVRTTQLIGGGLAMRQVNRDKVDELYRIRNVAAHGGSLSDIPRKQQAAVRDCPDVYRQLIRSFLRLGTAPDWNTVELDPAFKDDGS
jgi:hypothetical protein